MVTLRATQKVLKRMARRVMEAAHSDTALGDWYVNRFVVDRQPLLLMVSSLSLLPIVEPARELRSLPERLPGIVRRRLMEFGMPDELIEPEIALMDSVAVAKTNNRSVLGTMNEFVRMAPYHLPEGVRFDVDALRDLEGWLQETPCRGPNRETLWPDKKPWELMERMHGRV